MTEQLFVLDTSAILSRKLNLSQGNFIIPDSVLEEIRLGKIARNLLWQEENIRVVKPARHSLEKVREAAAETGDLEQLSTTDMDVIAVALETGATLVTDDFAIENVASRLGIAYAGADLREISRVVRWQFRCTGCGKHFQKHTAVCPVCGHEVRRTVKSYKRS